MCTCPSMPCTGACRSRGRRRDERGDAAVWWSVLAVVGIILVCFVIWGLRVAFAPQLGNAQKRINTNTGPYIESTYNKFYDECGAIMANETRQKIYEKQLAEAKKTGTPDQVQRAEINLDAVVATHADLVTQYNADSSKTGTEAQHKASDLPWNVSLDSKDTQCAR